MVVNFLHGVQVSVFGCWFNLWLHKWRGIYAEKVVIPVDSAERKLCLGWFTLEIEH